MDGVPERGEEVFFIGIIDILIQVLLIDCLIQVLLIDRKCSSSGSSTSSYRCY
jgi:hypothetical protein